jgi:lysophospholipase L1-like esterase
MTTRQSSRRTFLKSSALAGLVSTLTPDLVFAGDLKDRKSNESAIEKGLVFLFQGDSITDGNRGRNTDPNHIMGHGYAFAVASRIGADFPERGFRFYNRGISGNKIPDLQKRWKEDSLDIKPDILSILVGINDASDSVKRPADAPGTDKFESGYRNLLEQSKEANPGILFVLGIPFVYPVGSRKENWNHWSESTLERSAVVRKLAAEYRAILVDYPGVFDKAMKKAPADYWIWDGIHPTIFGHEMMAREWIRQVGSKLKFLRKYQY